MKNSSRIIATILAILALNFSTSMWNAFKAPVEAAAAVEQAKDSILAYTFAQQMARGNIVGPMIIGLFLFVIFLIWRKPLSAAIRGWRGVSSAMGLLFVLSAAMTITSCGVLGPAKVLPLKTVGPNETAFLIPLEGDSTKQAKFESVDFLKTHKVMSKQIEIPVRQYDTGRMPWDFKWIPTVRLITVDRSLVTREWIEGSTDNDKKNDALSVASLESINFHLGVNLTAYITEEDAPTYLYWHGTKKLEEVVDTNVRGYLQGVMSDEFGKLRLEDGKVRKASIFTAANTMTITKFKEVGITISYVGSAKGFMYDDPLIQARINETQTAEMNVEVARKKNLEQIELNKAIVSKAVADRQAAEEFQKAAEAQSSKIELDIRMVQAQATAAAAEKWNGQMPMSILPQGSQLLFGLDKPHKINE